MEKGMVFASTKDIMVRSGLTSDIHKMEMYEVYTFQADTFKYNSYNMFQRLYINDLQ
jgi:hypothetical protein